MTVYAGGNFASIGGRKRPFLAALDASTGVPIGPDLGLDDAAYALTVSGATLHVGGLFTSVGSRPRPCIARVDLSRSNAVGAVLAP